ncbi:hypothetical protein GPECTOR_7g1089 [Gonium pectorale]|uniref:EF-hand domain-containing protein n=1 Tax=Gonium pectorale TaxID=33097 RepID=A0A150GTJ4_GONPE|nr:hypothetical protein GPECTOR_7g1089 [Gonium pectorale]|eukprot:KXZ53196.1 hypothetical protein GPECTOR_7g1089 [Gonium pectorale]
MSTGVDKEMVTVNVNNTSTISTVDVLRKAGTARRAAIDGFLQELDHNHDGNINADDLLSMLEGVATQRRQRRWMIFAIVGLLFFCCATVAATVGLTYAVVHALKDTEASAVL